MSWDSSAGKPTVSRQGTTRAGSVSDGARWSRRRRFRLVSPRTPRQLFSPATADDPDVAVEGLGVFRLALPNRPVINLFAVAGVQPKHFKVAVGVVPETHRHLPVGRAEGPCRRSFR